MDFGDMLLSLAIMVGKSVLMLVALLIFIAYALYADRKVWAAVQLRRGPNVVGPWGLLQSFADLLKFVVKEPVIPASANKGMFLLAPLVTATLALASWAVIPLDEGWAIADINVGILYLFAISSLGVYGIIMGGWASNSKYPFLGALRSAAQMVSYEVSLGFVIITVLMCAGTLNLSKIVAAQDTALGILGWYWLPLLPMFVIFFISAMAETNRPPFDLPEAESELVAGFAVEYSSTPYLLFMLGEYVAIMSMCAFGTILFLGGWLSPIPFPPFTWVPGVIWFVLKASFLFFMIAIVKAMVPRYRYDQLMRLGWKVFLPTLARHGRGRGGRPETHRPRAGRDAVSGASHEARSSRPVPSSEGVRVGVLPRHAVLLQAEGDHQLSLRDDAPQPALPGRACPAPLPQRGGALHRLQALRSDLPGSGHHHRGRSAPQRRHAADDPLRHRHGEVHLLRPVPGGLPGRRHRRGAELRVFGRDPRGTALRQEQASRERGALGAGDRPQHRAGCAVQVSEARGGGVFAARRSAFGSAACPARAMKL